MIFQIKESGWWSEIVNGNTHQKHSQTIYGLSFVVDEIYEFYKWNTWFLCDSQYSMKNNVIQPLV